MANDTLPPQNGGLLAVNPTGSLKRVVNRYEDIKEALDGGTLDFLVVGPEVGYFLDDEGLLKGLPLNVPASLFAGRCVYGNVVLTAAQPDDEGNTLPPPETGMKALAILAHQWSRVWNHAITIGQDLELPADPATVPPPRIMAIPDNASLEDVLRMLEGDEG